MLFIKKSLFIIYFSLIFFTVLSQNRTIRGVVYGENHENSKITKEPLINANIFWLSKSAGTVSDLNGNFSIEQRDQKDYLLVFSYIGYKSDTINILNENSALKVVLKSENQLAEIVIDQKSGTYMSKLKPVQTQIITHEGLQKLACCNLSESFQNSATLDVAYSDAITGSKQIQMLGLAGVYSQIMIEKIPAIRGLTTYYGLDYVPGSWMESIQISKGTSSVVTGYESTTGQINIELKKPQHSEKLFINLYGNSDQKAEGNLNTSIKLNHNWSTMLLAHSSYLNNKVDMNHDMFVDVPLSKQFNVMNRWFYENKRNREIQFGFNVLSDNRNGGQLFHHAEAGNDSIPHYLINTDTRVLKFFGKHGYMFDNDKEQSLGVIVTGQNYKQNSEIGSNTYSGEENSLYINAIFQSRIINSKFHISSGMSFMFDDYNEHFNDSTILRTESIPGTFGELTYSKNEKLTLILGIRDDYNSEFGNFFTPRLHFKYSLNEHTILRISAGKGYRIANIFAENSSIFTSSRKVIFSEKLNPEIAYNAGINITHEIIIDNQRNITGSIDFYHTSFENQVIVDLEKDVNQVIFYNLDGKSYSNSLQADITAKPLKRLEITTAFRINDVKTTINNELITKPFVSRYKGLLAISYSTKYDRIQFDFTTQFNGKARIPDTSQNPEIYQLNKESQDFFLLFGQITYKFRLLDVYAGVENITNFKQKNPIIAYDQPFSKYFDASMVWGPIIGRMFYFGLRYSIPEN